ncbi:MAG: DUF5688 family protein [Lachnospiraceae bacterium]|nr:DUF5688 family protein [Lachnospiraceae bacterium]
MMDFEKFKENITGSIQSLLPEKYQEGNVILSQEDRINGSHTALMVKIEGENTAASVNLSQFYEIYEAGVMSFEDILSEISSQIQTEMPAGLDTASLSDYEKMKDSLFIRVCGIEQNQELLAHVPHKKVEDLAVTYHLLISSGDEVIGSAMVTNTQFEKFGVTAERLHQDAIENSPKIFPMQLISLRDLLTENIRQEMEAEGMPKELQELILESMYPESTEALYVVTNDNRFNGAGALFYPDVMKEIGERLGTDYVVLPSSTHEMVIARDDGSRSAYEWEFMVADINQKEVPQNEHLTDNAYHYDRENQVFERFSTFEARMEEKEKAAARDAQGRHPSSLVPKKESVLKRLDEKKSIVKAREEGKGKAATRDTDKKKDYMLS